MQVARESRLPPCVDRTRELRPGCDLVAGRVSLGIYTDDWAFGYVAGWAGGGAALVAIKAAGTRIQRTAERILAAVEEQVPEPAELAGDG
jgi:hypothetical protein